MYRLLNEERAQATVEMVVAAPVMIVLALIAYNLADFSAAVARFDRVAPDIVMAHAVSPEGEGGAGASAGANPLNRRVTPPFGLCRLCAGANTLVK